MEWRGGYEERARGYEGRARGYAGRSVYTGISASGLYNVVYVYTTN